MRINVEYNYFDYTKLNSFTGIVTDIYQDEEKMILVLKNDIKVQASCYNEVDLDLSLGDKVKVDGKFSIPSDNTNPNLFNYKNFLKSKDIYYLFTVNSIEKIDDNKNIFYAIKNFLISIINKRGSSSYLYTFILGDNSYLDANIKNGYQKLGISHLFSISGMHISIFSGFILLILKKMKICENKRYFISCFFIFFYMFLVNFCPSVLRSGIFFIGISINTIFYFNIKPINLLLLTISLILFINPFIIYNTGFLYSSIITASLIIFSSLINKYNNYFIKLFLTSLIAFFFSFPISVYSYYQINLLTVFYNLIFVPMISIIIFPLSLLVLICPFLDSFFSFLIKIVEFLSMKMASINSNIIFMKPNLLFIFIYYLIIFMMFYFRKKFLYFIFFLIIFIHYNYNIIFPSNYMLMIDVGQGDSILLHSGRYNVLVDTGGERYGSSTLATNTLIPLFKSLGIRKIDYLFLSHGDYDHVGETINLINDFNVEYVYFNEGELVSNEKEIISLLNEKQINYSFCYEGTNYKIGAYSLYSLGTNLNDENDSSIIMYGLVDNYSFLMMGDASIKSEKVMLSKYNISNIDILKVGHHGSKTSTSDLLLSTIKPKYAVISAGKDNKFNHPSQEVINLLNKYDINTYITSRDGAILIKFEKKVTFLTF